MYLPHAQTWLAKVLAMFLINFTILLEVVAQSLICALSTRVHQKIIIQLYTALDLSF